MPKPLPDYLTVMGCEPPASNDWEAYRQYWKAYEKRVDATLGEGFCESHTLIKTFYPPGKTHGYLVFIGHAQSRVMAEQAQGVVYAGTEGASHA